MKPSGFGDQPLGTSAFGLGHRDLKVTWGSLVVRTVAAGRLTVRTVAARVEVE